MIVMIWASIGLIGCGQDNDSDNNSQARAENQATIEQQDSESTFTNDALPEDFPKEIPLIEGAFTQVVLSSEGSMTVSYEVRRSFQEVLKVYKEYYRTAGYTDMNETLIEDSYIGSGTLDGKQFLVILSVPAEDSSITGVTLTYKDPIN